MERRRPNSASFDGMLEIAMRQHSVPSLSTSPPSNAPSTARLVNSVRSSGLFGLNTHLAETGCVVLGKDAGRGNVYTTRFRIDHKNQRAHLCQSIVREDITPCCESSEDEPATCASFIGTLVLSEACLFTMHVSTIILGAVKEGLNMRSEQETLHLIHSIIETVVSILLISARVIFAWRSHKELMEHAHKVEYRSEEDAGVSFTGKNIIHWLRVFTALGASLCVMLIATFLLFYYVAHLGWTILTNQFAIVVIIMTGGLMAKRIETSYKIIREDQHKAVLYESTLLLDECKQALSGGVQEQQRVELRERVLVFIRALRDTELFVMPSHLEIVKGYKSLHNPVARTEMHSLV